MENHSGLKKEILEAIQNDALLYGKVAYILGVKPVTLPRLLSANHKKLTHGPVLQVIRKHLGKAQDSELLEEIQVPQKQTA